MSGFAPDEAVYDVYVALDDFDDGGGDVFAGVDVDGCAVASVGVHGHGCAYGLEQGALVDPGEDESGAVERFGALG